MQHRRLRRPRRNAGDKKSEPIPLSTQINTWVKTLAILAGGFWAWYVWYHRDWPALQKREKADSKVTWAHREKDTIHAEYSVTMTNGGSKPFAIGRAHLRVWTLVKSVGYAKDSGFLDVNRFIRNGHKPIVDADFTTDSMDTLKARKYCDTLEYPLGALFCQKYLSGITWTENFDIPIVLDTPKLALFLVQFYEEGEKEPFDWTYFWDPVGGDSFCVKAPSKESQKPMQHNQPRKANTSN